MLSSGYVNLEPRPAPPRSAGQFELQKETSNANPTIAHRDYAHSSSPPCLWPRRRRSALPSVLRGPRWAGCWHLLGLRPAPIRYPTTRRPRHRIRDISGSRATGAGDPTGTTGCRGLLDGPSGCRRLLDARNWATAMGHTSGIPVTGGRRLVSTAGINYGYGYFGTGFVGGYWSGGAFNYNTAVMPVNQTVIHNTYNRTVINRGTLPVVREWRSTAAAAASTRGPRTPNSSRVNAASPPTRRRPPPASRLPRPWDACRVNSRASANRGNTNGR